MRAAASRSTTSSRSASIGLIKAIDRFDLERGVELPTYAVPTIVGEIKRHFRDRALGGARAAPAQGAALRCSRSLIEDLSSRARPLADDRRARRGRRRRRGRGRRGARGRPRVHGRVADEPRAEDGAELDRCRRSATTSEGFETHRGPAAARGRDRGARRARAPDHRAALRRRADAVADRARARHLADARLAPDPACARDDARELERGGVDAEER